MTETEIIEQRLLEKTNLNTQVGMARSPLIHAINTKDMSLFDRLLSSDADASMIYHVDQTTESALLHALSSDNTIFLEKLLPLCKNDTFYQIYNNSSGFNYDLSLGNGNLLEVCLSAGNYHMYLKKESDYMLEKAKIIIEHINAWKDFDFSRFFQKKDFFRTIFKQERSYQVVLENMKEDYLKPLLNIHYNSSPPHPALYIFDTCYKKMKLLSKVIQLLEVNENISEGNTVFHYYALKNYPPEFDQYTFVHENVVKTFLKKGFLPNLANDAGEKPEEKLSDSLSYKEFQARYLDSILSEKKQNLKKIKL